MKIYESEGVTWVEPDDFYDISKTLTCGQCFRWKYLGEHAYLGVHTNHAVTVYQEAPGKPIALLTDLDTARRVWVPYFDFDAQYDRKIKDLALDNYARSAYEYSKGIHLLRQDFWEMVISYIISQRNRLANIGAVVDRIAAACGEEINYSGIKLYAFPSAQDMLEVSPSVWDTFMLGYRYEYVRNIVEVAARDPEGFASIQFMPTEEAYATLTRYRGIGPKVANCILLFGMHRTESFPIDIWIQRVIDNHYGGSLDASKFGDMAGIIQQYMFNYIRN